MMAAALVVWIFVRTDCPISNRYAPVIEQLHRKHGNIQLVYSEPGITEALAAGHRAEYGLTAPAVLDLDHSRVRRAGVTVTPEAVVFHNGRIVYRGRIDDRQTGLATARARATRHDLADVLEGRTPPARFRGAFGCAIEPLRPTAAH